MLTEREHLHKEAAAALAKGPVLDPDTGAPLSYSQLLRTSDRDLWIQAYANDLGRLAQGVNGSRGNDTIRFISRSAVPAGRSVTYGRKVATMRPGKDEERRVRLTVGGDRLEYFGNSSSTPASLTTFKILLNSVVSTRRAKFKSIDIKDFYYGTPLERPEYMRLHYDELPPTIVDEYDLDSIVHDGWVYVEILKGMPGLKQAGKIANDRLVWHLAHFGFAPVRHTPSLWRHESRPISFCLVVDDFGVKYENEADFNYLARSLEHMYKIKVDHTGSQYLGITLRWDYAARQVTMSMPGYIERALSRFKYSPSKQRHGPAPYTPPTFGKKVQYSVIPDDSASLPASAKRHVQCVVGTLLYYALALDLTLLVALADIAAVQSSPTEETMSRVTHILDYVATHPDASVTYRASGMVLASESDASYLSAPNGRSRVGAIHYFTEAPRIENGKPSSPIQRNGVIHVMSKITRIVMSSVMEAEVGAAFEAARDACFIRLACSELGHPQPPTTIRVDNTAAVGFATGATKVKRAKAIDMRFHWLADRVKQGQFTIFWTPGHKNLHADFVTKLHPPSHNLHMRDKFFATVHLANQVVSLILKGCGKTSGSTPERFPVRRTRETARQCAPLHPSAPERVSPRARARAPRGDTIKT